MTQVGCVCGARLEAKPELAGRRVQCPRCGQPLSIPHAQPTQPIKVACGCGKMFAAEPRLAGQSLKCPGCGGAIQVPLGNANPSPLQPMLLQPSPMQAAPMMQPTGAPMPVAGGIPGLAPTPQPVRRRVQRKVKRIKKGSQGQGKM